MRALFLPRYGPLAGSSRYMTYDYLPYFKEVGIDYTVSPLLDDLYLRFSRKLPSGMYRVAKLGPHILNQSLIRIWRTITASHYDVVVLEKDVIPYLPYGFESFLFSFSGRVVVMYDERTDAFYEEHRNSLIRRLTDNKIQRIIERASHVVVWNPVVLEFAKENNESVTEFSTGIDLVRYRVKTDYEISGRSVSIGWIGSPSGYDYIKDIEPALKKLAKIYDVELHVVSSDPYSSNDFRVTNHRWSVETEVDDLRVMDIGIMPLPDTKWAAGKSGCKMFQYMAVGLPVVVSPVGINGEVIKNGENGLLARTEDEWFHQLARLIEDASLRRRLGRTGREYIEVQNSQAANAKTFIDILLDVAEKDG